MATKIIKGENGFTIKVGDVTTPITKIVDDGKTLALPPNSANRKYFSIATFEKFAVNNELELTYKPTVTLGASTRSKKSLTEYMSPEDLAVYNEIIARAEEARKEATKKTPLTEVEKLQRSIERLEAKRAALLNEVK